MEGTCALVSIALSIFAETVTLR